MPYALLSELDRLSPEQRDTITHIIPDDGEWTMEQIMEYILMPLDTPAQIEAGE